MLCKPMASGDMEKVVCVTVANEVKTELEGHVERKVIVRYLL